MDFTAMIDEKTINQIVLIFESSHLLWRKCPPRKPPWIQDTKEDLKTEGRIFLLYGNIHTIVENWSFQFFFLRLNQYIGF